MELEVPDNVNENNLYIADKVLPKFKLKDNYIGEIGIKYNVLDYKLNNNKIENIQDDDDNEYKLIDEITDGDSFFIDDVTAIEIRQGGMYAQKSFYLSENFNWKILRDNNNTLILLPYIKD